MSIFTKEMEARLLQLLDKELELFSQMREQTMKQAEFLTADNTSAFDKSLEIRQQLINKINGLHQESDPLMQSYLSFSAAPGNKKSRAIEAAEEKRTALISECIALNEENIAAVTKKSESYTERITKLSSSKKGIGAYIQSVPNDAELFDKKT